MFLRLLSCCVDPGEAANMTGATAGEELVKNLMEGGCVDSHLQDQVLNHLSRAGRRKMDTCTF